VLYDKEKGCIESERMYEASRPRKRLTPRVEALEIECVVMTSVCRYFLSSEADRLYDYMMRRWKINLVLLLNALLMSRWDRSNALCGFREEKKGETIRAFP